MRAGGFTNGLTPNGGQAECQTERQQQPNSNMKQQKMYDMRVSGLAVLTAALALSAAAPAMAAKITVFDVSGATDTYADAINDPGAITGWYLDSKSNAHGFVRAPGGTITTFYDTGATTVAAINDKEAVTGSWQDTSDV
jgi:hypothetical protein